MPSGSCLAMRATSTLSARENVALPLSLNGLPAGDVDAHLAALGLGGRGAAYPDQLSGGEQQRVAIARALVHRPRLILADEPTANLDTANGQQVMEIMKKLNKETGVTFVFATHDPRVISYATRVVTLKDGVIEKDSASGAK